MLVRAMENHPVFSRPSDWNRRRRMSRRQLERHWTVRACRVLQLHSPLPGCRRPKSRCWQRSALPVPCR